LPGVSTTLIPDVANRRVLGEDRDALLALEVRRGTGSRCVLAMHDPIDGLLVGVESPDAWLDGSSDGDHDRRD
jgi:hypothetical protein